MTFWTDFKKILDFVFFPLALSIFGVAAWFPFDKGQSTVHIQVIPFLCFQVLEEMVKFCLDAA